MNEHDRCIKIDLEYCGYWIGCDLPAGHSGDHHTRAVLLDSDAIDRDTSSGFVRYRLAQ